MAYLNDIKIISYLANKPEVALTKTGRPYSNISVRLLHKNIRGEHVVDWLNVTCFDYDAELVVRDCAIGDLLLIVGYLALHHWEKNNQPVSRVLVMANHVSLLAKGNGLLPPPSLEDMQSADPLAMDDGAQPWVSGIVPQANGNVRNQNYSASYPQPMPDGTWQMPQGQVNPETKQWLQNKGMVNYPKQHIASPSRTMPAQAVPTNNPQQTGWICDPVLKRKVEAIIPENLSGWRDTVKLPTGKRIPKRNYENLVQSQEKILMKMPVEERQNVLTLAAQYRGIKIPLEKYIPSTDAPARPPTDREESNRMASNLSESEIDGSMSTNESESQNNAATTKATPPAAPIAGADPNEWYQDKDGQWLRQESL